MNLNEKRDLLAACGFIAISLLILFVAIPLGVQEPKKVKFVALSPSYYPRLVCYCLFLFGLLLLIKKVLATKKSVAQDEASTRLQPRLLLTLAGILFFYYITLPTLGFVLSSTVVLFVLLLLAGDRNIVALFIIPLLLPIAVYWFFTKVANIPIPAGILEPILVGA